MKSLPKNIKQGDVILIHWNDAYSKAGSWTSRQVMLNDTACRCFSVGVFVGQNKDGDVMFGHSWDTDLTKDGAIGGAAGRPLQMIQKITILKKGNQIK